VNKPLRRAALFCFALFGLLLINANYLQVVKAEEYKDKPNNVRKIREEYSRERGEILVGSRPVASSVPTDDKLKYLRKYDPVLGYAPITGFYSFVLGAPRGIEGAENSFLAGTDDSFFVTRVVDLVTGKQSKGGSALLTINEAAQQAAIERLKGKKGAVVALEPKTGKILAMASSPTYDPNLLSGHDSGEINENWKRLNNDKNRPLENRAVTTLYPPGSTFKIVTAAAALSSGKYQPDTKVPGPARVKLPLSNLTLPNQNEQPCGDGQPTLTFALQKSCNTVFANIGNDIGAEALRKQAEKFWFNSELKVPLTASTSRFPTKMDRPQTMLSSIGQYDVAATPLQMAMVSAAVANGGKVMKPYLIEELRTPDLDTKSRTKEQALGQAITSDVAGQLAQMMKAVVMEDEGTGRNARIDGVEVGGKTGTAQQAKNRNPHAWFTSFAIDNGDPKVAVAVVIEDGAENRDDISGGKLAAPIAKAVMEAVLGR
jgi:penicillin-binding protein A